MKSYIHLLYVPTMACNMACKYCYLEDETKDLKTGHSPIETLKYAVEKCREEEIIPFNISLHGGEVTCLDPKDFREITGYISEYYDKNGGLLTGAGFRVGQPHIKTNLLDLDRHMDAIREYGVSVSGSIDLPLSLHRKYRVGKDGKDTLDKILANAELLRELPNHKKVSATIFREHLECIDEIIEDIWYLHKNTCLDMTDFNFMIGFENSAGILHALTEEEQLEFFHRIRDAFMGTEIEEGLKGAWFREFGPDYCTNSVNCGGKFYLLERNGDIYSCVRGQKNPDFYYGNIYEESMSRIMERGAEKIRAVHESCGFDEECGNCGYLYLCRTGCPFVKRQQKRAKSYTCLLQKELYELWEIPAHNYPRPDALDYVCEMHPERIEDYALARIPNGIPDLRTIIREDPKLKYIYDPSVFILNIDGNDFNLESQIIKKVRSFTFITPESKVLLYAKKGIFDEECSYPENNAIYIQLLTGDTIVYGDEGRTKQRHIANEMIYKQVAEEEESDREGYIKIDISDFLRRYGKYLSKEQENNIFFTTTSLRDYHYTKQKNNAFYHIQAADLPFQNIEFCYLTLEEKI
ncbi:radical SAM protein [Lachnospiraceae bacterium C1.1]|nr:SPASM domain-containing protein [Lachnospiraceae bacterium C1.1]